MPLLNANICDKKSKRNLNDKGHYFLKSEDIKNAIQIFKQAHIVNNYNIEITNNLGFANMKTGKVDAVLKH